MILLSIGQTAVMPHISILGVSPQLPFLVALAWGLLNGRQEGMVWAFFAGFFMDIFSISPIGLTAFVYLVSVTAVLLIQELFPTSRVIMPIILTALATAIQLILYILTLWVLTQGSSLPALTTMPNLILLNTIAMLPLYWAMYTLLKTIRPRRISL